MVMDEPDHSPPSRNGASPEAIEDLLRTISEIESSGGVAVEDGENAPDAECFSDGEDENCQGEAQTQGKHCWRNRSRGRPKLRREFRHLDQAIDLDDIHRKKCAFYDSLFSEEMPEALPGPSMHEYFRRLETFRNAHGRRDRYNHLRRLKKEKRAMELLPPSYLERIFAIHSGVGIFAFPAVDRPLIPNFRYDDIRRAKAFARLCEIWDEMDNPSILPWEIPQNEKEQKSWEDPLIGVDQAFAESLRPVVVNSEDNVSPISASASAFNESSYAQIRSRTASA